MTININFMSSFICFLQQLPLRYKQTKLNKASVCSSVDLCNNNYDNNISLNGSHFTGLKTYTCMQRLIIYKTGDPSYRLAQCGFNCHLEDHFRS